MKDSHMVTYKAGILRRSLPLLDSPSTCASIPAPAAIYRYDFTGTLFLTAHNPLAFHDFP